MNKKNDELGYCQQSKCWNTHDKGKHVLCYYYICSPLCFGTKLSSCRPSIVQVQGIKLYIPLVGSSSCVCYTIEACLWGIPDEVNKLSICFIIWPWVSSIRTNSKAGQLFGGYDRNCELVQNAERGATYISCPNVLDLLQRMPNAQNTPGSESQLSIFAPAQGGRSQGCLHILPFLAARRFYNDESLPRLVAQSLAS